MRCFQTIFCQDLISRQTVPQAIRVYTTVNKVDFCCFLLVRYRNVPLYLFSRRENKNQKFLVIFNINLH